MKWHRDTAESFSSPGRVLSRDGGVSGEAGRAEDSARSRPGVRVFKQCREGESSRLCPCSMSGVVQSACSWGDAWGQLVWLQGACWEGSSALGKMCT